MFATLNRISLLVFPPILSLVVGCHPNSDSSESAISKQATATSAVIVSPDRNQNCRSAYIENAVSEHDLSEPTTAVLPTLTRRDGKSFSIDKDGKNMAAQLQTVVNNTCNYSHQIDVLRTARDSGNKEFVSTFIEIAKTCSRDPKRKRVALESLYAAAQLGDIHDELLAFAEDYKANPVLAWSAFLIPGSNPGDKRLMEIVDQIPNDTKDELICYALAQVRHARFIAGKTATIPNIGAKVAYLLPKYGVLEHESYQLKTKPLNVWIGQELLRLSEQHPDAVAKALFDYNRVSEEGEYPIQSRNMNQKYRHLVLARLSEKAKTEYERLEAEAKQTKEPQQPKK